jgi:hypothetical protein
MMTLRDGCGRGFGVGGNTESGLGGTAGGSSNGKIGSGGFAGFLGGEIGGRGGGISVGREGGGGGGSIGFGGSSAEARETAESPPNTMTRMRLLGVFIFVTQDWIGIGRIKHPSAGRMPDGLSLCSRNRKRWTSVRRSP